MFFLKTCDICMQEMVQASIDSAQCAQPVGRPGKIKFRPVSAGHTILPLHLCTQNNYWPRASRRASSTSQDLHSSQRGGTFIMYNVEFYEFFVTNVSHLLMDRFRTFSEQEQFLEYIFLQQPRVQNFNVYHNTVEKNKPFIALL